MTKNHFPKLEESFLKSLIQVEMNQEPRLTYQGMGVFDPQYNRNVFYGEVFEKGRQEMLSDTSIEEFRRAATWLELAERIEEPSRYGVSSSDIKMSVEKCWKIWHPNDNYYVSKGMVIAAAMHLGFKYDWNPGRGLNVSINVCPEWRKTHDGLFDHVQRAS